jgi:SSS family solute:Na+ symporter
MQNVLELMLYSYAFMVSGLFIPILGAFILEEKSILAAFGYAFGGATTIY